MPTKRQRLTVSVSSETLFKIVAIIAAGYFFKLTAEIWGLILAAFVLAFALIPLVDKLQKRKIPRVISLIVIYASLIGLLSLSIYLIIPPIIKETGELANSLPVYIQSAQGMLFDFGVQYPWLKSLTDSVDSLNKSLVAASGGLMQTVSGFFGGALSFLLVLVITFYMVAEEGSLKKIIMSLTPIKQKKHIAILTDKVQAKISAWLLGQFFLCFIIFIFTYIGLLIAGVKYALVLALIAGITEAIPYLGPIIASIPGIFLAFTQSPILALVVAGIYILIQQLENNLLVPLVMKQAVGLNPIVSIAVLLFGFQLGGVLGAVLAIPVATSAIVIYKDWSEYANKKHL